MSNLTDLIAFIEDSPSDDSWWGSSKWENHLSVSIPDWREVLQNSENWDKIEKVRSKKCYDHLCKNLVAAGGFKLAKRWLHSEVSDQKKASINWLGDNVSMWGEFDKDMKNELLDEFFSSPGDPFKRATRYITRYIKKIVDYVPASKIKELRRIIESAGDREYLTRIDEMISRREKASEVLSSEQQQIKKLQYIIGNVDDREYLTRIDEMISRREKASEVLSSEQQQRSPYAPNSNERELIARVIEITRRIEYLPTALPPIFISYETPPIFIAYPELEEDDDDEYQIRRNREQRNDEYQIPRNPERRRPETISIEELLGVYRSRDQQIIIYERGIKWRRHRYDEEWLRSVVLIHEIGHWITHVLPKPGVPTWSTDLFDLSEMDLHEGWAQLITWWIAEQVGGPFKRTFEELNRNQSSPYHVFEDFKDEPIDKVMRSLEKLRLLSWPARLQDWKLALR